MCRIMPLALVAALAAASAGRAEEPPAAPFDDAAFLKAIAMGGRFEARLSDLVGSQTRNGEVRNLAAGILADSLLGAKALKAAAEAAGVELPTELDEAHRKRYEAFKGRKGGEDLDRDYVKAVVRGHTAGVELLTRASKEAKSPAVRAFAAKALPALQKRLDAAKTLDK